MSLLIAIVLALISGVLLPSEIAFWRYLVLMLCGACIGAIMWERSKDASGRREK